MPAAHSLDTFARFPGRSPGSLRMLLVNIDFLPDAALHSAALGLDMVARSRAVEPAPAALGVPRPRRAPAVALAQRAAQRGAISTGVGGGDPALARDVVPEPEHRPRCGGALRLPFAAGRRRRRSESGAPQRPHRQRCWGTAWRRGAGTVRVSRRRSGAGRDPEGPVESRRFRPPSGLADIRAPRRIPQTFHLLRREVAPAIPRGRST
eukprot:gene15689-biopygen10548